MCGIAGIAGQAPSVSREVVGRMCAHMAWRGPDEDGFFEADEVAFGHRRLRIIDLSPSGRQPMTSPDGQVTLVFNGEIYNYTELRKLLIAQGHRFRGTSDTEVLLHSYLEHGRSFLEGL